MTTLDEIITGIDRIWPFSGQESWDASGLVCGNRATTIRRILLAVDPVAAVVSEAEELDVDLVITHHPLLLRGVTSVAEDGYKGALIARLIRADCALLSCHTNADVVVGGVSAVIADALVLRDVSPLSARPDGATGIGRVGDLPASTSLREFAERCAALFPDTAQGLRVAGDPEQTVSRVALCGGAGDSLLGDARAAGADVYVTSDLRHHPASEFREQSLLGDGAALVDVSHWAAESLWLDTAALQLAELVPDAEITVSRRRTDPFDFVVH
ncbi:Nif3-like dinuclear metal center hexameric protein [Mycetocola reblochoni]|uniref:GTP cyclohydrolase 1 type 2 homolog n=2 Tax=Mycetocola reblochoni TaxID=331618 RepID=A0A1R4K5G2_9MICO|nr:Nif3-like dinuclear metal center hexameric protein [Mycetocola reblochoni]RLP68008.1 Nif3-like dinuclear metal center hexameric protein [Mycetocola reblochoni]SJN39701.1 Hypothetical protein YbgI [Mycetocola reblochoni REB411]